MKTESFVWNLVNSGTEIEEYELSAGNEKVLTLTHHLPSEIAKIECTGYRRNFHILKGGFLLNTTILQNEYGVTIGHLNHELWQNNGGSVYLYDDKFHFAIDNNSTVKVFVYKKSKKEPEAVCLLPFVNTTVKENFNGTNYSSLIIALCWFILHSSAKKENKFFPTPTYNTSANSKNLVA